MYLRNFSRSQDAHKVETVVSKPIFPLVPELQAVVASVPAQVQCQGAHYLAKQFKSLVSKPENLYLIFTMTENISQSAVASTS